MKPLTEIETEVLKLLAIGWPCKLVADRLGKSHKTIEKQRQSVMNKLNIHNRVELAHYALNLGLVQNIYDAGNRGNGGEQLFPKQ